MKKICCAIIGCLLLTVAMIPLASAQGDPEASERDSAFEQEIYERLAQINSEAVPIFQDATRAMDSGDWVTAKRGYEEVLQLAPDFPDAARRLSYVDLALEDFESALKHAEQAYTADPSPYNQSALARAMLASEEPGMVAEALPHAQAAAEALPEELDINFILLYAGAMNEDVEVIRQASAALVRLAPDFPEGHFFAGLVAAEDGKWVEAEQELLLSQELGMSAEHVQSVLDQGVSSHARAQRWLGRGGYIFGGWFVGLVILFGVGVLLSGLTLRAASRPRPATQFEIGRAERSVRAIYRVVIAIASLYFYISIPFMILMVVAATGGVFYLFALIGRIPLRLAIILGAAALTTLYAIVRSVFARVKQADPGRPLSKEEAPALWSLAEEVAKRLDTRPIDAIYVRVGPEIAVMERGGLLKKVRDAGQRCLILGLGALSGMTQSQFKAILGHEYGHFSNRDTAGGNLAKQVRLSMHHMALTLAYNGLARWYNPAWLFLSGFNIVFLRITLGASRLQETLADRYAAVAFGVQNFVNGLTHIIRQDLAFNTQVNDEIGAALEQARDLQNIYTLPPLRGEAQLKRLKVKEDEIMDRPTSPYDSHPAPCERIAMVEQIEAAGVVEDDHRPVWDLLPNAEELQSEMTAIVQANVREQQSRAKRFASQPA